MAMSIPRGLSETAILPEIGRSCSLSSGAPENSSSVSGPWHATISWVHLVVSFLERRRQVARASAFLILGLFTLTLACVRKTPSDREIWAEVDGAPIYRDQVEKYYHSRMAPG